MRNTFYKYLPVVFGLLLVWLLFHPPLWLEPLGLLGGLTHLALVGLLLLSVVPFLALANMPEELKIRPLGEADVSAELLRLRKQFHQLGFRDADAPLRIDVALAVIVMGLVHSTEPVYGKVFQTGTLPPKISQDLVSILDGERGGLTTNADPQGAALPASSGGFRQVLPKQPLEALFKAHLEGIRYLQEQGVRMRPVSPDAFRCDLTMATRRQRETFLSSPLRGSLLLVWRAVTRRVPFIGCLREQKIASQQLRSLLGGQAQRAF